MAGPPTLTAVVPLKALTAAKGRLAPDLAPARRRELAAWMCSHVLTTLLAAPSVDDVLVVAGDEEAAALARQHGVRAAIPPRPGLHAALDLADALLAGIPASLVVAADLPLLAVADVEALCGAVPAGAPHIAAVAIAPTRDGGTGGLLRRPADVMGTAFGPGSAAAHRTLAAEAGVLATVVEADGFALDIDTAGQLRALLDTDARLARWAG
jgi:2-phospho-L-lactate/phosphoenolpyruvate guanylyltransferase